MANAKLKTTLWPLWAEVHVICGTKLPQTSCAPATTKIQPSAGEQGQNEVNTAQYTRIQQGNCTRSEEQTREYA